MTIDEAIETQKTYLKGEEAVESSELIASMKLGVEALKRERECRENQPREEWLLLPGETE